MLQSTGMKILVLLSLLAACGGALFPAGQPPKPDPRLLASFIPVTAGPWLSEADQVYDAQTIFSYIDGAGEVYRSYNMKLLVARRFHKDGRPDLVVDAFDMGTSADAFGVFTHDLEGEEAGLGQGSLYRAGLLTFWKDRYFFSVYTEEETATTKALVLDLGRAIAKAVPGEGPKPEILGLLPAEGLEAGRIRYFHNFSVLNYHRFVAETDVLRLADAAGAVLAPYQGSGGRSELLIVLYHGDAAAAAAGISFLKSQKAAGPASAVDNAFRAKNGRWTAMRVAGRLGAVVFDAASAKDAAARLDAVERLIKSWPGRTDRSGHETP